MELSEEEIKAIEKVREVIRIDKERRIVTLYDEKPLFRDQLQIIIDLINKQQEKIVDLKTKLAIETIDNKYNQEERDEETIPRYKIREKIEHYNNELEHIKNGEEFENEKPMYYWGKVALEELLEDN